MQLIHGGRQSHVEMTGGVAPVAPTPYVRAAFWGGNEKHCPDFPAYSPTVLDTAGVEWRMG